MNLKQKYRTLFFFITAITYLELAYRLLIFKGLGIDFAFPLLFAFPAGAFLFIISGFYSEKVNKVLVIVFTAVISFIYAVQLIYYSIFRMPLTLYSITGAGEAMQFADILASVIIKNILSLILIFAPLIFILLFTGRFVFSRLRPLSIAIVSIFCILSYAASLVCVNLTGNNGVSQRVLYYYVYSPELSVNKLGLMATMYLDMKRLAFGFEQSDYNEGADGNTDVGSDTETAPDYTKSADNTTGSDMKGSVSDTGESPDNGGADQNDGSEDAGNSSGVAVYSPENYNMLNIDFDKLIANEKDAVLLSMHKYFSSIKPEKKNKYTGMFKGYNLILITAESFSPFAVSPDLTPTLYKMSEEGFVFRNFYNPVWGVSTSDGEYVACTGIIPKSGIWSFAKSGRNYMPFTMGRQFGKLGYLTKAYHNHSYTYYKRNISHPNMGYEFKAVGNGLNVKKTWPESDLEMIEVTADEYMGRQPFHTYYMTVSGHMNYTFFGNYIANKNRGLVAKLPFSEESRAYIAANLELEFAMKALVDKIEAAGAADKTVIAISADHYPYGLPRESIDELAGHKVEDNFELYKSTFILWKKDMDPVVIDKPCSSLDIIPTLSNLFGLEYDSRLLMGTNMLSKSAPLVIFSNRSWITDRAKNNTVTNEVLFTENSQKDNEYIKAINRIVAGKFEYSAKILDTDYYGKVIQKP